MMSEDRLEVGPVPAMVYVAMFGATIVGQLGGMIIDAIAIGRRVLWFPLVLSVVLEAIVGARLGASRLGRTMTFSESARVSGYYSAGLGAISMPLAIWTVAATRGSSTTLAVSSSAARALGLVLALVVAVFVAGAVLRQLLMVLLSWRRR